MLQSMDNILSGIDIFTVGQRHLSGIGIPASDTDSEITPSPTLPSSSLTKNISGSNMMERLICSLVDVYLFNCLCSYILSPSGPGTIFPPEGGGGGYFVIKCVDAYVEIYIIYTYNWNIGNKSDGCEFWTDSKGLHLLFFSIMATFLL
jgi:hypothetical protein